MTATKQASTLGKRAKQEGCKGACSKAAGGGGEEEEKDDQDDSNNIIQKGARRTRIYGLKFGHTKFCNGQEGILDGFDA